MYCSLPHKYKPTHITQAPVLCSQLTLEVTVDPEATGVVAVDEFESWVGPCVVTSITCDFESNGCGWKDDDNYPLQWTRTKAEDGSQYIGYDHTSRTQFGTYAAHFFHADSLF